MNNAEDPALVKKYISAKRKPSRTCINTMKKVHLGIKNANLKALRTLIMENNNSEKDIKREKVDRGKW